MNEKSILNYPGSKKKLLNFIYENTKKFIDKDKYILDIFSGTGCVSQMFRLHNYKVFANDVEVYASNISSTLLSNSYKINFYEFNKNYEFNKDRLTNLLNDLINNEQELINNKDYDIINFNDKIPKIWKTNFKMDIEGFSIHSINDLNLNIKNIPFCLFTLYYSGIYYGLFQSIEIDSIRYAIQQEDIENRNVLFTALYYAMKEASFSKDGHMAQPLNQEKYIDKLFKVRSKNIYDLFSNKLEEITSTKNEGPAGKSFNCEFTSLINLQEIKDNVGFIYADPPYTDMQYSRYFHLLTTITNYEYPNMTYKGDKLTSGLYANNRYQSKISSKSNSLNELRKLIYFAATNNINLCFSYAFPVDTKKQATDRYTMNITDLQKEMEESFKYVEIIKENYEHCNNRNSESKKVYEYLIIGSNTVHHEKNDSKDDNDQLINEFKKNVNNIKASNKSPVYNRMMYWSQKPYNITDLILSIFSKDNNIILDPFMGSGVTLIECLNKKYNLKSIGVDINDMPIFICKNSLKTIPKNENLKLVKIKEKILNLNNYYYTYCPYCNNNNAIIKKIIYDIEPTINIKEITYTCPCSKKDLSKSPDERDIKSFNENHSINYLNDIDLIENSRIAVKKGEKISSKFSKRSFFILDQIKKIIDEEKDENLNEILNFIYLSIIHKSKILDLKMSSQWPLWIPKKNCLERNIITLFIDAIDKFTKSNSFIEENYYLNSFVKTYKDLSTNHSLIIKNGIQNISEETIPSSSIDLIITDPPYLGQVPYSEYMQLYQPFANNKIDYENEIVITNAKGREKDYKNYLNLMNQSFKNISRLLKENHYMFLYFHDSNLAIWKDLINIFNSSNLVFQTSIHISKNQKTLKKILDPKKTMNGESLLIFKKLSNYKNNISNNLNYLDDIKMICDKMFSEKEYITTSELYDNGILEYIIKNGLLDEIASKYKDLTEIFNLILKWNNENGMWSKKEIE